jgi:predicted esterase
MVHGRNAAPANILDLVPRLARPDLAYVAPAAPNRTWYPLSFMAPIEQNEPSLSASLAILADAIAEVEQSGVPRERIVLLGFSQGACLASEFMVRNAARYGGLIAFTGGLIGPPGTAWHYPGTFDGTPVFLGSGDPDAHVPVSRVAETAEVFTRMGASVRTRIYPGMGHLVNDDEVRMAQVILDAASS